MVISPEGWIPEKTRTGGFVLTAPECSSSRALR
jgi:hypothetical protein